MFTERDRGRQTAIETERQRDIETERQRERNRQRETERQTDRATDRQRRYKGHQASVHIETTRLGLPLQFDV